MLAYVYDRSLPNSASSLTLHVWNEELARWEHLPDLSRRTDNFYFNPDRLLGAPPTLAQKWVDMHAEYAELLASLEELRRLQEAALTPVSAENCLPLPKLVPVQQSETASGPRRSTRSKKTSINPPRRSTRSKKTPSIPPRRSARLAARCA